MIPHHPGLGPYTSSDEKFYHNYYMWVPYLLFAQSLSFFIPRLLHHLFQDARVQCVLAELHNIFPYRETRDDKYGDISLYFKDWYNNQNWWAFTLVMCDALNVIIVLLNIFLVDWYLGYNFFLYGPRSIQYLCTSLANRGSDPFDVLFPKMTKCTLNTYGPSGTIQEHDGLCILPINVFNEKLYLFIWFLFMSLGLFMLGYGLVCTMILFSADFRCSYLNRYVLAGRKDMKRKLTRILTLTGFGDWMMLLLIAKNTDQVIFTQIMETLKYPDYHYDLEPLDDENQRLAKLHEESDSYVTTSGMSYGNEDRYLKKV